MSCTWYFLTSLILFLVPLGSTHWSRPPSHFLQLPFHASLAHAPQQRRKSGHFASGRVEKKKAEVHQWSSFRPSWVWPQFRLAALIEGSSSRRRSSSTTWESTNKNNNDAAATAAAAASPSPAPASYLYNTTSAKNSSSTNLNPHSPVPQTSAWLTDTMWHIAGSDSPPQLIPLKSHGLCLSWMVWRYQGYFGTARYNLQQPWGALGCLGALLELKGPAAPQTNFPLRLTCEQQGRREPGRSRRGSCSSSSSSSFSWSQ